MNRGLLRMDLAPLRESRDFRLLLASRSVTLFGTDAAAVALLVQAKQLTGSAVAVGLLGVAELLPIIVFGLYGGLLADRFDRGRMLRWCEAGLGVLAALLTVNAALPHPAVWPLYLLAAAMTMLSSLQRPSFDAAVPRTVRRDRLSAASALLSMTSNAGEIVATALGGAVAAAAGAGFVYGLDAVDLRGVLVAADPAQPAAAARGGRARPRPGAARRHLRAALRPRPPRPDRLLPGRPVRHDVRLPERAVPVPGR